MARATPLTGDLGRSIQTGRPVLAMVGTALVPTLQLAGAALLVSLVIALPAGVAAATRRGRAADAAASLAALAGLSLPSFWLGILLILAFSIGVPLLPSSGYVGVHRRRRSTPCGTWCCRRSPSARRWPRPPCG